MTSMRVRKKRAKRNFLAPFSFLPKAFWLVDYKADLTFSIALVFEPGFLVSFDLGLS